MRGTELGAENFNQRLQAPVPVHPAQIRHGFAIDGAREKKLVFCRRKSTLAEQRSYLNSTAGRETEQFLFEVFSGPKERAITPIVDLRALNKYIDSTNSGC